MIAPAQPRPATTCGAWRDAGRRWSLVCALAWAGCVLQPAVDPAPEPLPLGGPVQIPFGDVPADDRPLVEFYDGVLLRMQQAYRERDLPQLRALLSQYDRSGIPTWARKRIQGYHAVAAGLAFELHAATSTLAVALAPAPASGAGAPVESAASEVVGERPEVVIGRKVAFGLRMPPAPDGPTRLGGRQSGDSITFGVALSVEDLFVDGTRQRHEHQELVPLDRTLELAGDALLQLPIEVDLPDSGAVRRHLLVRVELLPGYVQRGELRAPVQRTTMASCALTQWPDGHQRMHRDPLLHLRAALQLGDAAHFRHVAVAAALTSGVDREQALQLLIDWVRLGNPDQARVAMASLQDLTGVRLPIGDRDAWLAWWQARR